MAVGRVLILVGLLLAGVGVLLVVAERWQLPFGHLPGDLFWRKGNTTVYFPLVTCLLISLALTVLFWLFGRR